MTLRSTLAMLIVFTCAPAFAQIGDSPLSLSIAPALQSYQAPAEAETIITVTGEASEARPASRPAMTGGNDDLLVEMPAIEVAAPAQLPEPIDLTAVPADLIERLRNGFSMPNINNDLVLYHQLWYLNRPDYLRRMVERGNRYMYFIIEELEKRGMPTELALLPMVESAYNPMAYSRSRASGLWQFIPSTGKNYKLEQNWWVDQRRDILASTTAALDYLQTIYEMHGDWHLALASYNWGEGAVGRAIGKNKAKGLPGDYLSLSMPDETRNYVPKLQALKNIFSSPALVANIGLRAAPNRPYFGTISKRANIDVKVAARLAEMPVEDFVALNPSHNRPVIKAETPLVIPADKVDTFVSNLEDHQGRDKPLSAWQSYTLRPGDKLEKVAPRFGMTVANLKAVNGIQGRIKLAPGYTLLVSGNDRGAALDMSAPVEQPRLPVADLAPATSGRTHKVRKGETLDKLAKRYGISLAELKRLNHLHSDRVAPGTVLTLASATRGASHSEEKQTTTTARQARPGKTTPQITHYTVRRGDTLASIAKRFKVEMNDIRRRNHVSPASLQPGQILTIQAAQHG